MSYDLFFSVWKLDVAEVIATPGGSQFTSTESIESRLDRNKVRINSFEMEDERIIMSAIKLFLKGQN